MNVHHGTYIALKNVKHNMKNKQKLSKNWIVLKTETVKAKFGRTSMFNFNGTMKIFYVLNRDDRVHW